MTVCLLEEDLVFHWPTVSQQESNREERWVTGRAEVHFRSISLTSGWSGHIRLIMLPIYLSIHHSQLFKLRKHSRTLYFIKVGYDSDLVAKRRTWEEDGTDTQKYRFSLWAARLAPQAINTRRMNSPVCLTQWLHVSECGPMSVSSIEMERRKRHLEPSQFANILWQS